MARKNLLSGLTAGNSPALPDSAADLVGAVRVPTGSGSRGAIGAVTRSIEQLKSQAILDLDPSVIEASLIADRIEDSGNGHDDLVASIRDHGQQVPILVRPHPTAGGRYQIVYGRRRLRALAELGRSVRAIVKPLNDEQLVIAQGQENSARTDLSFIERAVFAARLEEAGFSRDTIMAALSVDKFGLSRLIGAAVKVPRVIIEAIGPAPKVGRDRWTELAAHLERPAALEAATSLIEHGDFARFDSDDRFNRVLSAATPKREPGARPTVIKAASGARIAKMRQDDKAVTLQILKKTDPDFGDFVAKALPELYAAYRRGRDVQE